MRRHLVGTSLGQTLLRARSLLELRRIPFANPERAALTANAILADRLIVGLCEGKGIFLDIGAHIGSVFTAVHRTFPEVEILAIEADPEKASAISEKFPYCTVVQTAVGEVPGTATFYIHDSQSGYSSLANGQGATRDMTVPIDTLDRLFPDISIDVAKIDIEGAELGALRGGVNLLGRSRPVVMFESAGIEENDLGYSPAGLWKFFDDHGFCILTPARLAHDAPALSLEVFLDAHHYPQQSINFFAVPAEKRIEVRDTARRILSVRPA